MTIPPLPTALDTDDVVDNDQVDKVRALLGFLRDERPVFRGQAYYPTLNEIPDASPQSAGFGVAGSFHYTPAVNVGGWTVNGADSDPESLVVPETGIYLLIGSAQWGASSGGFRQVWPVINSSGITALGSVHDVDTAINHQQQFSHVFDLTAGDELDLRFYQNSGSALTVTAYLSAIWLTSS